MNNINTLKGEKKIKPTNSSNFSRQYLEHMSLGQRPKKKKKNLNKD